MGTGSKVVKWIFLSPIILILLAVAFCEINKAYWDHQVRLMCEKDGGTTVFEKVDISKADYPDLQLTSRDVVILPNEKYARPDDQFFVSHKDEVVIHSTKPHVWRDEMLMVRRSDNKILARQVSYARRGGDFPTGILHDSYFSCGNEEVNLLAFQSTITISGEPK